MIAPALVRPRFEGRDRGLTRSARAGWAGCSSPRRSSMSSLLVGLPFLLATRLQLLHLTICTIRRHGSSG